MITLASFLEDFGTVTAPPAVTDPGIDAETMETRRLEAFEEGYRAGWDDCVKAQASETSALSSGLLQHLSDLSFTYQEAYGAATKAMTPLLEEMVNALLPELARKTIGAHLVEQLTALSQQIGTCAVEVAVSPGRADAVAPLLEGEFAFPIRLIEDSSLADEQADIRFADTERQIDLTDMLTAFSTAVDGFAEDTKRTLAHG